MSGLETLVGSLGLSFVSGINLYATLLVVGVGQHFGLITGLPDELEILSNPWVIGASAVMYLVEFFADKIPFVNTVWDGIHTFIRPVGAALLVLAATRDLGPVTQVLSVLLGGSVALGSHATKASFRALANTAPEPATQSVISVAEDLGVVGLLALTYSYPMVALAVMVVLLAGMAIVTPLLFRTIYFFGRCVCGFVLGVVRDGPPPRPYWLDQEIEKSTVSGEIRAIPAFSRAIPGVPRMRAGWLTWGGDRCSFSYKRTLGARTVTLANDGPPEIAVERRLLCDIIHFGDDVGKGRRVFLPKDSARYFALGVRHSDISAKPARSVG